MNASLQQEFTAALDALVEQVKQDRSILAAILCGSLSHDTVWAKSDIDLVLVTTDDRKVQSATDDGLSLFAGRVNIHAMLMPRTAFRQTVEGSLGQAFMHSFLAKGRLLYTHDETIAALCARLKQIGDRDTELQLLNAACHALPAIDKARKWFVTRTDLDYSSLWILYAANALARIEVVGRRLLADREVLPQALSLNPAFFATIYTDLLNTKKSAAQVRAALDAIDGYVAERAPELFRPLLDHLRDAGETRSCREIENHFERNFGVTGVSIACEYLADRGLIGRAAVSTRLTRKSNVDVQELAFFYVSPSVSE